MPVQELPLATSGRNWGGLAINNGSLMFMVDGKVALEVPLRDVSSVSVKGGVGGCRGSLMFMVDGKMALEVPLKDVLSVSVKNVWTGAGATRCRRCQWLELLLQPPCSHTLEQGWRRDQAPR